MRACNSQQLQLQLLIMSALRSSYCWMLFTRLLLNFAIKITISGIWLTHML